jgi:hypothetical protein
MGILNCSNKGPGPLQRGDNKNAKMMWVHLKILFRTRTEPEYRSYLHESFLI